MEKTCHPAHSPEAVTQVISSLDAMVQMGRRPGLRAEVQQRVLSVLEAALEIRKLPGGEVNKAAPLVIQVDGHEVTYSLDLDIESVEILSVEPVRDGHPPPDLLPGLRVLGRPS